VNPYSLSHLSDAVLVRDLDAAVRRNCATTATELAHIAEFDARELFLPAAHPSMVSYCVHVLHLSEGSARKRVYAGRTAHQFPAIFEMVAAGRLNLSAVVMLAPYLSPGNAHELLEVVAHRTRPEIEQVLAQRFPRSNQPMLPPIAEPGCPGDRSDAPDHDSPEGERNPGCVQNETVVTAPASAAPASARAPWPITVDSTDHDKIREAQELLSHQIPSRDVTKVLSRLIELGLAQLRKQKHGAGRRPRASMCRTSQNPRYIPNAVKQAVWERDKGQCTFTSESAYRCPAREFIEFDHAEPVARGGIATVANIRLRCRAHNQYEAERTFGSEFMRHKREAARSRSARRPPAPEPSMSAAASEVVPWLRGLGFRIPEANAAATLCNEMADTPIEQRVRVALGYFRKAYPNRPAAMA
jgi:hypothetical protein